MSKKKEIHLRELKRAFRKCLRIFESAVARGSLGCDITDLRENYSIPSRISHVGNRNDFLHIDWTQVGKDGQLLVGGGQNIERQKQMINDVNKALLLFIKHDEQYEIKASL